MGRVTVFSIHGCPHCSRAKATLEEHGVEFTEINVEDYPARRKDMVALAGALTVPQVFFNDKHVGGADAVATLAEDGGLDALWEETQAQGEPQEPGLEVPQGPPVEPVKPSERTEEAFEADGKSLTLIELVEAISKTFGKSFFAGAKLVSLLKGLYSLPESGDVVAAGVADKLLKAGGIVAEKSATLNPDKAGRFNGKASYGLLAARYPTAINAFRVWTDRVDDPMVVVTTLKKRLDGIMGKHRDGEGKVDFVAVANDSEFVGFDEATSELSTVTLAKLEPKTRLAFTINLYNLLTQHAFIKVGIPTSNLGRLNFFDYQGYLLGSEQFFSFNALENGVIRVNKVPPYHLSKTIPSGDPRIQAVMPTLDCRIHFALNCGAAACPSVKKYTADAVDEELTVASRAFFEDDSNCLVDVSSGSVRLSTILKWYSSDFGDSPLEVARTVRKFLSGTKADDMDTVLALGKKLKLTYTPYDWSTDASNFRDYSRTKACIIM